MNANQEKDHLQDSMRRSDCAFPAPEPYLAVEQPGKHMFVFTLHLDNNYRHNINDLDQM